MSALLGHCALLGERSESNSIRSCVAPSSAAAPATILALSGWAWPDIARAAGRPAGGAGRPSASLTGSRAVEDVFAMGLLSRSARRPRNSARSTTTLAANGSGSSGQLAVVRGKT